MKPARGDAARAPHRRWGAFFAVGAMGFVLQVAVFECLIDLVSWTWPAATVVAVEAAILHNFAWHRHWTWADRPVERALSQLAAFHTANGATSLVGNVLAMALYAGWMRLPNVLAMTLAVATTSAINFILADRWVFRRGAAIALVVLAATPASAAAAPPSVETVAAWNHYIAGVEAAHAPAVGVSASERARLEAGDLVVDRTCGPRCPADIDVPSGRIEHWRGAVFVPDVSVAALAAALERKPLAQEDVVRSRVLERDGHHQRVYLRITRQSIVTVTYDTEHDVTFAIAPDGTATSRSIMTSIVEVDDPGTPEEHRRAPGEGHGFLWRLNVYGRYSPMDGGVLVQYESVTLSRAVPYLLRPLAAPIITRIARESMRRSLDAVRTRGQRVTVDGDREQERGARERVAG